VFAGRDLACVRGGRPVFRGLAFNLDAGDALVLTGRNGAGKSSLLRLMAGLGRPAKGVLLWNDADVGEDRSAHAARLHYVGHADALKPVLTVAENLGFWARFGGEAAAVGPALTAFGIGALAALPARFLSQGQRRRVALARLLTRDAPLWLLDEPRASLDAAAVDLLDAVIAEHRRRGGMVVLSLHGPDHPPAATVLNVGAFAAAGSC
jgi:heme exporter protein A